MTWTNDMQAVLVNRASEGKSFQDVADELGLTRNAVAGRAVRTGVRFSGALGSRSPRPRRPAALKARIIAEARVSPQLEVAKRYGVHPNTVWRWCAA